MVTEKPQQDLPEGDARFDCGGDMACINPGHVAQADRMQRFFIGGALMLLTVTSSLESMNWRIWVALMLQTDLLLTGLFGWCPVYWTCRRVS